MSVRECVKLRERERTKERDAQRAAALEAKAARDAARAQSGVAGDGWAQVASRAKKPGESSGPSTRSTTPVQNPFGSRTLFSALSGDTDGGSKKERLVLRSGLGAGKSRSQPVEVVDDWEEAEEKEEEVEREQEQETEGQKVVEESLDEVSGQDHVQPIAEPVSEAGPEAEKTAVDVTE